MISNYAIEKKIMELNNDALALRILINHARSIRDMEVSSPGAKNAIERVIKTLYNEERFIHRHIGILKDHLIDTPKDDNKHIIYSMQSETIQIIEEERKDE